MSSFFWTEPINDFRVRSYHHQAFASKVDETIYSLESEEALMLHNEEQIFTIQQMWCCALKSKQQTQHTAPQIGFNAFILDFTLKTRTYIKKNVNLFMVIT